MLRKFLSTGCMVILMLSVGCQEAVEEEDMAASLTETEFIQIFNGKDLTGWERSGNARWAVEDGFLVGTQGENNAPGDLFTKNTYEDFLLTVTYRVEWPCNSGVWFRYQSPQTVLSRQDVSCNEYGQDSRGPRRLEHDKGLCRG